MGAISTTSTRPATMLTLQRKTIEKWSHFRKMPFAQVTEGMQVTDDHVVLRGTADLSALSGKLAVHVSDLLADSGDLDHGVRVCRKDEGYRYTSQREGTTYYTYQHLVTTNTVPTLMPLRLTVHCKEESKVVLNGGHESHEVIYVLEGDVLMHWQESPGAETRSARLGTGDTVYLKPGVSHSFISSTDSEATLLAFNF